MAYVDRRSGTNRTASLITVGAIHAAMGAALIYGLAPGVVDLIKPVQTTTFDVTVPETPPPLPETAPEESTTSSVITAPQQAIDLIPSPAPADPVVPLDPYVPPIPSPPTAMPTEPSASPKPAFTPRTARPANDQSRWVTASDYPGRDLRAGNEGVTSFRLVIGSNGRVQACETTSSSGFASLDKAACDRVTSRARFDAATNGSGEKIVGTYTGSVRWQIPE